MKIDVGTKVSSRSTDRTYKITHRIGGGSFGDVFSALMLPSETKVAIKVMKISGSKEHVQQMVNEIQIMKKAHELSSRRVPGLYEAFQLSSHNVFDRSNFICIVMEFIDGVTASELVLNLRPLNETVALYIIHEIATVLVSLHAQQLIHRDIKASNIMVDKQGKVYLCDFGVSKILGADIYSTSTMSGTPFWMAPEILNSEAHNCAVDIYSLGITCIELVTGSPPVAKISRENSNPNINSAKQISARDIEASLAKRQFSREFRDIVSACVTYDPSKRIAASDLIKLVQARITGTTFDHKLNLASLVKML